MGGALNANFENTLVCPGDFAHVEDDDIDDEDDNGDDTND
jgi:hypothetical protein